MTALNQRENLVIQCRRMALLLECLVCMSLLSSAFPLTYGNPVWYLRLSDSMAGLASVVLLALVLLTSSALLLDRDNSLSSTNARRGLHLVKRWAIGFALLVPLQIICFGWLIVDSDRQLDLRLGQFEGQKNSLVSPLLASDSEGEFRQRLSQLQSTALAIPVTSINTGTLSQQKQQLNALSNGFLSTVKANLRSERSNMLLNSLPSTIGVLLGSAIISAFLFNIKGFWTDWTSTHSL